MSHKNQTIFTVVFPIFLFAIILTYLPLLFDSYSLNQFESQKLRSLYTTNLNRTSNLNTYCTGQTFNITAQETQTKQGYYSTLSTYFSGNSSEIIGYLVALNFDGLLTQTQTLLWGFIIYVGPFVVGLIVLLIMWPFILCCCMCPASCPADCCRKSSKQMYGKCQLLIPLLSTMFLMFVCIGTSIPSMTRANPYFSKLECSSSMFIDNILNGNLTEDGSVFFSGLTTMVEEFQYLKGNLSTIQTQISQLDGSTGTPMETANNYAIDAMTTISEMPNGVDTNALTLSYSYPLHDTTNNTGTLNSAFVDVLGTYLTEGTLTHTLYQTVSAVKDSLQSIKNSSAEISPELTQGSMGNNIDEVITLINPLIDVLKTTDSLLTGILEMTHSIDSYFDSYAIAYYGSVLGLCLLVITGCILIKCFKVIGCRYLLYFACFFIFFFCLVGLILSIVLAASMPIFFYTCDYLTTSLSSGDSFKSMVNQIGGSQYEDFGNYFSVCLSDGDGDILSTMSTSLNGQIDHLSNAIFGTINYNFTEKNNQTNKVFDEVQNTIDNYGTGKIPDFDTSSTFGIGQISSFNSISSKSAYTSSCPPGSFSVFYTDVWVPSTSNNYQAFVDCGTKVQITTADCPSGMDTSCSFSRCLDSFDFIVAYNGAGGTAQLETDINSRYGTTCTAFNDHMKSFYTRYVTVVDDAIGNTGDDHGDTTKVTGRFMDSRNKTDVLLNYMDGTLKPLFASISSNLQTTSSITDPTEGLLAGLNCKLMGEDITRMTNSICTTMFNSLFFTFFTIGLISFSLLFGICCMTCTGVQHYKDAEKKRIKSSEVVLTKDKDQTASVIQF